MVKWAQAFRQFGSALLHLHRLYRITFTMVPAAVRYAPVAILRSHSVPAVIWGEDALRQYGVPTILFNLHLLVPDPVAVADIFISTKKYVRAPPLEGDFRDCDLDGRAVRVTLLGEDHKQCWRDVTLLPAKDWAYPIEELSPLKSLLDGPEAVEATFGLHFPPFAPFIDSLLATWLLSPWSDGELGHSWAKVALWISYIYGCKIPALTYPRVGRVVGEGEEGPFIENARHFAEKLRQGVRPLHFALAKGDVGVLGAPVWREFRGSLVEEMERTNALY